MNLTKQWHIAGYSNLPAAHIADSVNQQLTMHDTVVVTAPPGAGKSTLLPLTILREYVKEGKVLMLEPRRLAARQIAERMAYMLGEPVGQTVGYRVRLESKVSSHTRIEVLTEGILSKMLIDDPTLEGVSVVIFDEFHERSLNSDFALALTRETQQIIRPDLRVVIMSATINAAEICQKLNAELVESQGRIFPVQIIHETAEPSMQTTAEIAEAVARKVLTAHRNHEGDILAFLPGEAEIRRCEELLNEAIDNHTAGSDGSKVTKVFPLYGLLSVQEQQKAIAPSHEGERKIVLATPIAETSLTIEGVRIVVDSGLCKTIVFNAQNALSQLKTVRISLDMADQRSGRAGRVAEGICYRLWSMATEHRMEENRKPEILDADLTAMLLDVAAWGECEAEQINWLTPPPTAHLLQAKHLLEMLNAVDDHQKITPHGRKLASIACHPRIAEMMVTAQSPAQKSLAADIAALLEEKDPLANDATAGADINVRIEKLRRFRSSGSMGQSLSRINKIADQYRSYFHVAADNSPVDPYETGRLIAAAYPERIAFNVNAGRGLYRMANGEQVILETNDILSAHNWLSVASANTQSGKDGRVFLASPVSETDLSEHAKVREIVSWDSKRGSIIAQKEKRVGNILLEAQPLSNPSREEITHAICEAVRKDGTSMLDFNDQVQNLQRRVATVSQWHPELELPDLSTENVLLRADEWLPLYLGRASTTNELKKIDLTTALWGLLDYNQQQEVEKLAPSHIQVPTGSRIKVEYRQGAELPILRVRLQECFGMADTPRVDNGSRPVLLELLSPGFKPVQLTQDLRSFWQNTYFEVRKELRRRYPKHYWPDNPLEAEATRGVKR